MKTLYIRDAGVPARGTRTGARELIQTMAARAQTWTLALIVIARGDRRRLMDAVSIGARAPILSGAYPDNLPPLHSFTLVCYTEGLAY